MGTVGTKIIAAVPGLALSMEIKKSREENERYLTDRKLRAGLTFRWSWQRPASVRG